MNEAGDKMATNRGATLPKGRRKKACPFIKVKAGSAVVPIYRTACKGRLRFTLSFYRDGRRMRKMFNDLESAKKEALFVAQRIQSGMQHVPDLKPHERDTFKAAEALLEKLGIPLYAAVEDYGRARTLAGSESLFLMGMEYSKMFGKIIRRATVSEVVAELLKIKEQDGASVAYLGQLRTTLNRFATKFPGPILAIGAFAGIRMAELERLDWKAVDLERKFIEIRAGQAKTASRRVIPISDNLAAWLTPLERKGKIVRTKELQTHVPALARALKMEWPPNLLLDSFISYRIAIVQSAAQVALEAGNSASIIFKHYRELTTPEVAEKWFSILPKHGQWENTLRYDRKKRRVSLNGVEVAALPVWLEFAIDLSAFSVSVFSISALPSLPFPRPPIFATSFAKASSYAKASADKTAVRKASTGRPVRPNGSSWAYRRKQIPRSKVRRHRYRVWIMTKMFHFSLIFLLVNLGGGCVALKPHEKAKS
jgi:hypothetical protein